MMDTLSAYLKHVKTHVEELAKHAKCSGTPPCIVPELTWTVSTYNLNIIKTIQQFSSTIQ